MILSIAAVVAAEVRLPALISDHMVVQRDTPIRIWGWADAGEEIRVSLTDRQGSTIADSEGRWSIALEAIPAGGPYTLTVDGKNKLVVHDVLIGEVWVASGQSNMEMRVGDSLNAEKEIAVSGNPEIRQFIVVKSWSDKPEDDVTGAWEVADPLTTGRFSAVAYYFSRTLNESLKVPVGVIHSSWGGTMAEAWTSLPALLSLDDLRVVREFKKAMQDDPGLLDDYRKQLVDWEARTFRKDPGNEGFARGWASPTFDASEWKTMPVPQTWDSVDGMNIDGAVWFRRDVEIPQDWIGQDLMLNLGPIDDFDTTYFGGVEVGATGKDTPAYFEMPRRYKIPASLNKSDKNTITVRVFDHWRGGGFTGEPAVLTLELASEASRQSIPLSGTWSYNVECAFEPIVGANPPPPPLAAGTSGSPATLFNAMIHPLLNYSIHGVIWYQGESNVSRAFQYRTLLPGMIRDWRNRWNQGDFPFLIVQLANLGPPDTIPVESDWAELREAQLLTSVNVPNCGLAVTIDIGEADDIHPKNKQEVGKRLASLALAELDASVQPRRPDYTALVVEGSRIRLDFDTKGRGLTSRDGRPLASFTIAGDDQKFIRASATIDGGSVWVWSDQVARPVAVRYGWSNNPDCTLCDESGIPISPFRTDTWKGITQDQ